MGPRRHVRMEALELGLRHHPQPRDEREDLVVQVREQNRSIATGTRATPRNGRCSGGGEGTRCRRTEGSLADPYRGVTTCDVGETEPAPRMQKAQQMPGFLSYAPKRTRTSTGLRPTRPATVLSRFIVLPFV